MRDQQLNPEERAIRRALMLNFSGKIKQSLQSEMSRSDAEGFRRGNPLENLFSMNSPPGDENPFVFRITCGSRFGCTVEIDGKEEVLRVSFEGGEPKLVSYPLVRSGNAISASDGRSVIPAEWIAQKIVGRLIQK